MPTVQHRKFDQGFIQDEASFLLPEGAVYSSKNMLFDKLGIARKRGGLTGFGATTTYSGSVIGSMLTDEGTHRLYAMGTGGVPIFRINPATGAYTTMTGTSNYGDLNPNGGRPFVHSGFMCFPCFSTSAASPAVGPLWVGGADGSTAFYTFTTPLGVGYAVGDKVITNAAADTATTHAVVGSIFYMNSAGGWYAGRITRIIGTTSFEVYPTPDLPVGGVGSAFYTSSFNQSNLTVGVPQATIGGKFGMSFQGRVVLGYISRRDTAGANRLEVFPRRVWFTNTLLEGFPPNGGVNRVSGAGFMNPAGYPTLNYFDIPGNDALTAMTPTGFGDAIFFSVNKAYRMTGNLTTQFGTAQSITWAVREIPNSVGCLSERSMRRTPRGVIFAHGSGIYSTDGASMRPLMNGRIQNYWKTIVAGANFAIYGSALMYGNHYYICGTSAGAFWGLCVNLDSLAWGPWSGKASQAASWIVSDATTAADDPSTTWALKWFDTSGGAPSMTNGQLLKMETAFNPTSSTKADNDGTTVNFEIVTKPYSEDSPTQQKTWERATVEYENLGGAAVSVTPAAVLDSSEIPAGGTNTVLPRQDVYTVTNATNATPIVITCGSHDITVDSWVHVQGVGGNTNANGPFRVQAVTGTTVTLMGSYGNAAYTSGGTIQNMDQRDIDLSSVSQGAQSNQSSMAYRINDTDSGGTQGAESFELYGITHSYGDRDPHNE